MLKNDTYEVVIGLEIHAQLNTNSKAFCSDKVEFGAAPNTLVSPISLGHPGTLPVHNKEAVNMAIMLGLACGCDIREYNTYDRKNYFYADLPKGYQITQMDTPICNNGKVEIILPDGSTKDINLTRIHMEEDTGKGLHDLDIENTLMDYNRAGTALVEIVTEPDFRSGDEAYAFLSEVRKLVRYLGVCDGNMEEGSLRADVNVSVRKPGAPLGTRTETKNLNSVRFIMQTIDAEVERQIEVIEDGGEIFQETRLFDTSTGMTRAMRSKEDAHDYRYFPDPDLLPLSVTQDYVDEIAAELPELPDDIRMRMVDEYGLSSYDAGVLTEERETALFYETASAGRDRKIVANWMSVELFGALNKAGKILAESPVSPAALGELVDLITQGTISGRIAKDVFAEMFETGEAAASIIESKGLKQVSDTGAIEALIDKVIAENQDKVDEYRGGKDKLFGFFVGQTMKLSGGQANPGMVNQMLKDKLK